jgi:hypothetical protein
MRFQVHRPGVVRGGGSNTRSGGAAVESSFYALSLPCKRVSGKQGALTN